MVKTAKIKVYLAVIFSLVLSGCCFFGEPARFSRKAKRVYMEVTAYCGCGKCCGYYRSCWSCWLVPYYKSGPNKGKRKVVGITSDGTKAKKGVIAADISIYPYGTKMYIPGYGWGVVHDTGSAIKGNHIDIFFPSHKEAMKWGRKKLWVTVIKK